MKAVPLFLAAVAAVLASGPVTGQEREPLGQPVGGAAVCGAELLESTAAEWLTDTPVLGDFTHDGGADAAVWGLMDGGLVVLVAKCAGEEVAEQWLFPIELEGTCAPSDAAVRAASPKIDAAVVQRVCARGEGRDECIHLRRENERRQALEDAGIREVRIEAPACRPLSLVWNPGLAAFLKMPR